MPFMPLWNGELLADTLDLDATEVGAYILLIIAQWQRKGASLPDDDKRLQRIARAGRNWPKVWARISEFFDTDADGIYSAKGREVFENVAARTIANSQNGARGGAAKALNIKNEALATATVSPQRKPTILEPDIREEREAKASPKKIGRLDALGVVMGVDPGTTAWSDGASAEAVMIWMAIGLTQAEIAAAAKLWEGAAPPERPSDLDALMNTAAAEKRKPKPKAKKATKGTSISPDWEMPREWKLWAFHEEGMSVDEIKLQAKVFKDYWLGIATQERGIKSDWESTWRNWVRKRMSELSKGARNVRQSGEGQQPPQGGQRIDPTIANIARLAGLEDAQGQRGDGAGGGGAEDGPIRLGP